MTYTIQKPQGKVFALPVRLLNLKPEEYVVREMKKDPFYHLTANVEEADADESAEVLRAIEGLSDDDLSIVSVKSFDL